MSGPRFLVDRSLGRVRLPRILRADGWTLLTLSEHYGERISQGVLDTDWLRLAGDNSWPVLAKDEKIRYRPAERAAIVRHGVRAFCLTSNNLTSEQMAECYIANRAAIWDRCTEAGPALFAVTRTTIREIDLAG